MSKVVVTTEIKERLAGLTGDKNVVLSRRANTLWAALLRSISQGGYVVFSAIMCPSPVFTAQHMGRYCDACLVSFGHTKIVDCGFWGALLTDDEDLAKNVANKLDTFNYCGVERIKQA
jgi:hypothetical protein